MKSFLLPLLCLFGSLSGCAPKIEAPMDHATVVAEHASMRLKNSSTSRTVKVLDPGDKVDVLEHQDNWYRVRFGEQHGWMEESTILTNATRVRIEEVAASSQQQTPQNTATLRSDTNYRVEAGRSSTVIRKLNGGTRVEVIDRITQPRPNSDRPDVWVKVRPSPAEAGWVLASALEFDVPPDISQYTEGYAYTAVKQVNQVQDSIAGPIHWYVVGERKPGADASIDFTGIRVFTWNLKKHRYETAFRAKGLRGVYPLEIGQDGVNPKFRIYVLGDDGKEKKPREFVMYGVIVREVKPKET